MYGNFCPPLYFIFHHEIVRSVLATENINLHAVNWKPVLAWLFSFHDILMRTTLATCQSVPNHRIIRNCFLILDILASSTCQSILTAQFLDFDNFCTTRIVISRALVHDTRPLSLVERRLPCAEYIRYWEHSSLSPVSTHVHFRCSTWMRPCRTGYGVAKYDILSNRGWQKLAAGRQTEHAPFSRSNCLPPLNWALLRLFVLEWIDSRSPLYRDWLTHAHTVQLRIQYIYTFVQYVVLYHLHVH